MHNATDRITALGRARQASGEAEDAVKNTVGKAS